MRKKAIIVLLLAVGISQTGITATYINPVKVYAETKTGDKYINGSTKITQDDLVMSPVVLGYLGKQKSGSGGRNKMVSYKDALFFLRILKKYLRQC